MAKRYEVDPQTTQAEIFRRQTVERFQTDVAKATHHGIGRNERVATVLCYLSLLRAANRLSLNAMVSIPAGGAVRQHFTSSDRHQAAHYLPCPIMVGGSYPWTYIVDPATRRSLESLFADVDHLPANFNKSDSMAEMKGLTDAFQQACAEVVRDARPAPAGQVHLAVVAHAYQTVWTPLGERALQEAITRKKRNPHVPPLQKDEFGNILNLAERSVPERAWNTEEQIAILSRYLEAMRVVPATLEASRVARLATSFRP
jgi:hypothetical protein